ncbi:hypothetical protein [Paraburkholderia strydomiana]|uniref:hypothetical protein n=1 Tax=Paraburkholderia strydomiana TaxID=1245417 RepID=UPI001BEAFA38|nr:hypothetical protein [Paraburkholderia strydomiana]MBT2791102.1 hypothetical protein [Paraburkholderia strydomiana]
MDTIPRDLYGFHHAITITIMPHARANEEMAQPSRLPFTGVGFLAHWLKRDLPAY